MNNIVNKFVLAGDKFMPEMHFRQPGFTYSACGLFTKNKIRIQKFKATEISRQIYKNELGKTCFQRDKVYGDFKDLPKRIASDKVLRDKLPVIHNIMDINADSHQWSTNILIRRLEILVLKQEEESLRIMNWPNYIGP